MAHCTLACMLVEVTGAFKLRLAQSLAPEVGPCVLSLHAGGADTPRQHTWGSDQQGSAGSVGSEGSPHAGTPLETLSIRKV